MVSLRGGESETAASFTLIRNNLPLVHSRTTDHNIFHFRKASIENRTIVLGMFFVIYVTKHQGGNLGKAVLFF